MRAVVAIAVVWALLVAGCSAAGTPIPPPLPSMEPGLAPSPSSVGLPVSPEPAAPAPSPTATPDESASAEQEENDDFEEEDTYQPTTPPTLSTGRAKGERMLLSGVRQDLRGTCSRISTDALAAIRCQPASNVAARVTVTLFATQAELMSAYDTVLATRDIPPLSNGGRCKPGKASEGGYVPGDGHGIVVVERAACYRSANGKAHYVATLPPYVLVQVDGKVVDIATLERWAWTGNLDQPGNPTVWRDTSS